MTTQHEHKNSFLKKAVSFLIVACMICGFAVPLTSVTASAAAPTTYSTITADSTASVSITTSGDAKYFKFVPTQSGTYRFYSANYTADPKASLLDASGNTLVTDDDSGSDNNFNFTYACSAGTTYYVKAYMWSSSSTGSYTLNVQTVSVVTPTPAPEGSVVDVNAAGGTNYPLFNSGRTESEGYSYGSTRGGSNNNINIHSYNNGGYDIFEQMPDTQIPATIEYVGCSFLLNVNVNELAKVSIYAYDTDETEGESDTLYLVDETSNDRYALGNLSGMDGSWNNTEFNISPDYLINGHQYHFSIVIDSAEGDDDHFWLLYIRTVNLIINGSTEPPVVPTTGIENADLSASISSSGLVSVVLTANAYAAETYTLEYKAVCAADNAQYGGKEYSVTIPTTSTEFDTTFQLESGAPRGTYEITVFIKDSAGTVIATRSDTASYGYSAVSYHANGGSQNLPTDGTTYSNGDTVTVKFDYVPSMYGYTFLGWSTDRNATEPMYTENGTKTFTIGASDVALYAVWGLDVCEHEWTETARTDATCTADGSLEETCSDCGETRTTPISKLGHDYVSGVCSRCGAEEPEADVWDGTVDTSWYNSTDTEFTIYTAEQLAGLAYLVNNGNTFSGKTIYLGNNIDLDNREWTPIGSNTSSDGCDFSTTSFQGIFNGNYFIITNLYINTTVYRRAGLFGAICSAEIRALALEGSVTMVQMHIVSGGILTGTMNDSSISECIIMGDVSVTDTASGSSMWAAAGAYAGAANGTNEINNCISGGNIYGCMPNDHRAYVGGFVGIPHGGSLHISNSYSNCDITAYGYEEGFAGGIVGTDGNYSSVYITNCFAVGEVNSNAHADALISHWNAFVSVNNSYYSSLLTSDYGNSTDETNFQTQSWIETNLGWDFDTVWEFRAGNDYPVLQGFGEGGGITPHTHTFEETSRTEPTCTVDGRINYECSCGETKVGVIPATGHNIETTVEVQVTCTTDGLIVDRCVNDGCHYEKRTVIHGEHNYSVTDRQDATCETPGYVEYTCSICEDKQYDRFEGRHNYEESARVEPQVDVEGSVTYTCTLCGDSYEILLPALTPVLKNSSVLLIQDSLPWAENVNRSLLETLKDRGVVSSYNIINTSALASFDLTQYGVVFIANDQSTAMYERLAANAEKLEAYVRAGGNLVYGACDEGWGGSGSLTHTLPGGVQTSNYYSVHNYIVNELHPIVTGVYTDNKSLRDELLKGNYCSHTYFEGGTLPEGTSIILRDANGNPTLIEYSLGDGTVIASGLTWEYFYVRDHYNMITNYSKYAYDDLLTYMVYMSHTCEHEYQIAEVVEKTCEENGYTKYVCTLCSHEYMGDIVLAEGHDHVETSRTDATCVSLGEIVYTCACGDVRVEPIDYADHIPGEWIEDVPATCVPGSQHKECTVCHAVLATGEIPPAADHVEGEWIVDVAPTATQTGSRHKECTVCHEVLVTESMPVLAKLVIDHVEAEAGHEVRVTIDIQNNPGIIGAVLTVEYDPALTLIAAEAGSAWSSLSFTRPHSFSNPCNFVWDGVNGADFDNGAILVLTFVLPADASVDTVYSISASYTSGNMINADLEAVELEIESGSITVTNSLGDVNDDGVVDVADVITLRRYLAGGYEVVIDEQAADMNGDGTITIGDVVLLRRYLVE